MIKLMIVFLFAPMSLVFAVVVPMSVDQGSKPAETSVLPLIGFSGCEEKECFKNFVSGPNVEDQKLIKWHLNQISGTDEEFKDSGAIDGE